jgi:hypothetical protein
MNERIRELSNQAVKAADAEYELKWQSKDPSLEPWEFIFRRTFAELIVQECVREMGRYEFIDVAIYKVKEHFGVK